MKYRDVWCLLQNNLGVRGEAGIGVQYCLLLQISLLLLLRFSLWCSLQCVSMEISLFSFSWLGFLNLEDWPLSSVFSCFLFQYRWPTVFSILPLNSGETSPVSMRPPGIRCRQSRSQLQHLPSRFCGCSRFPLVFCQCTVCVYMDAIGRSPHTLQHVSCSSLHITM